MYRIILLAVLLALVGCSSGDPSITSTKDMKKNVRCIDGVHYFVFSETVLYGRAGYMSPKFNKVTQKVELCNE